MHVIPFSNGGYVAHKINVEGLSSRFSAWFDEDGRLLDVERFDRLHRSFPVNPDSPAWKSIAGRGRYWQPAKA